MPSIYTSTYIPTTNLGPTESSFVPIPGLSTLSLNDGFLDDGGIAVINLYLGMIMAGSDTQSQFFINIEDNATGTTVISALLGGAGNYSSMAHVMTVYQIPQNTKPELQATWLMLGGPPGVLISAPTVFSFSAQVYPTIADQEAINIATL